MSTERMLYGYGLWHALQAHRFHAWFSAINLGIVASPFIATSKYLGEIINISKSLLVDDKTTRAIAHRIASITKSGFLEFLLHIIVNQSFDQAHRLGYLQYHLVKKGEIGKALALITQRISVDVLSNTYALPWWLAVAFAAGHTRFSNDDIAPPVIETHSLYVPPRLCVVALRRLANHTSDNVERMLNIPRTMFIVNPSIDFAAKVLLCAAGIIPKEVLDKQLVENLLGLLYLGEALRCYNKPSDIPYGQYTVLAREIEKTMNNSGVVSEKDLKRIFGEQIGAALMVLPIIADATKDFFESPKNIMRIASDILCLPEEFREISDEPWSTSRMVYWIDAMMRHRMFFPDIVPALSSASTLFMTLQSIFLRNLDNDAKDTALLKARLSVSNALLELHENVIGFPTIFHVYILDILESFAKTTKYDDVRQMIEASPLYNRVKQQAEEIVYALHALRFIEPLAQSISKNLKKSRLSQKFSLIESMMNSIERHSLKQWHGPGIMHENTQDLITA